jgi:hypothetical protein
VPVLDKLESNRTSGEVAEDCNHVLGWWKLMASAVLDRLQSRQRINPCFRGGRQGSRCGTTSKLKHRRLQHICHLHRSNCATYMSFDMFPLWLVFCQFSFHEAASGCCRGKPVHSLRAPQRRSRLSDSGVTMVFALETLLLCSDVDTKKFTLTRKRTRMRTDNPRGGWSQLHRLALAHQTD